MIEVKNLVLTIGKTEILKNINVSFADGKIHGLIGRNGSGKTMLMKCMIGFVKPTAGTIQINGKFIGKDTDFPENLGVIIETPGFIPYYSGYKNLKLLADLNRKIGKAEILSALEAVGLDPTLRRPVRKYSLGMRQRLGIAQAIMENPDVLILDEPMNGLDKEGVADMRKLFLSLKEQGKTIVIASHNAEDIEVLCDTVHEMEHGVIHMHDRSQLALLYKQEKFVFGNGKCRGGAVFVYK
jgi:ABC-2 type transport system ATP-binding protein